MKKDSFILTTGWNRQISIFPDDPNLTEVRPLYTWPRASQGAKWHSDDILSLAFLPPFTLATSSYDGEIVICNLDSGHILNRLIPDIASIEDKKSKSVDKCNKMNQYSVIFNRSKRAQRRFIGINWRRRNRSILEY